MKYLIFTAMLFFNIPVMAQTQSFSVRVEIVSPQNIATSSQVLTQDQANINRQVTETPNGGTLIQY